MNELTMTQMYWLTRLDGIIVFATMVMATSCILLTMSTVFGIIANIDGEDGMTNFAIRILKVLFPTFIISTIFAVFVPTTKEMALIYVAPKLVNSSIVREDIPKIYELGVDKLKEIISKKELTK